jgi:hypothetical protein
VADLLRDRAGSRSWSRARGAGGPWRASRRGCWRSRCCSSSRPGPTASLLLLLLARPREWPPAVAGRGGARAGRRRGHRGVAGGRSLRAGRDHERRARRPRLARGDAVPGAADRVPGRGGLESTAARALPPRSRAVARGRAAAPVPPAPARGPRGRPGTRRRRGSVSTPRATRWC